MRFQPSIMSCRALASSGSSSIFRRLQMESLNFSTLDLSTLVMVSPLWVRGCENEQDTMVRHTFLHIHHHRDAETCPVSSPFPALTLLPRLRSRPWQAQSSRLVRTPLAHTCRTGRLAPAASSSLAIQRQR